MPAELITQFCDCVNANPYIVVRTINKHRMNLGFLNLEGMAILCAASQSANVVDNICISAVGVERKPVEFLDFTSHLQNFSAEGQIIYLIHICWSLRARGWNLDAVNDCEKALQNVFVALQSD